MFQVSGFRLKATNADDNSRKGKNSQNDESAATKAYEDGI
jgi:hypothetical protein